MTGSPALFSSLGKYTFDCYLLLIYVRDAVRLLLTCILLSGREAKNFCLIK